jgi:hypothetical protein
MMAEFDGNLSERSWQSIELSTHISSRRLPSDLPVFLYILYSSIPREVKAFKDLCGLAWQRMSLLASTYVYRLALLKRWTKKEMASLWMQHTIVISRRTYFVHLRGNDFFLPLQHTGMFTSIKIKRLLHKPLEFNRETNIFKIL